MIPHHLTLSHSPKQMGFTIIEAMIAVLLLVILLGVGAPNMISLVEDSKVKQAALDITSDVYIARSNAVKLNCDVLLTPQDKSDWSKGWEVSYQAVNTTNDVTCASTGGTKIVLKKQDSYSGLSFTGPSALDSIIFQFDGRVQTGSSTDTSFDIVSSNSNTTARKRCVRLSPTGKPSTMVKNADESC